jgi:hypothetical protein
MGMPQILLSFENALTLANNVMIFEILMVLMEN